MLLVEDHETQRSVTHRVSVLDSPRHAAPGGRRRPRGADWPGRVRHYPPCPGRLAAWHAGAGRGALGIRHHPPRVAVGARDPLCPHDGAGRCLERRLLLRLDTPRARRDRAVLLRPLGARPVEPQGNFQAEQHISVGCIMTAASRERALKIVLVVFDLPLFVLLTISVVQFALHPPRCTAAAMLDAVLATMGAFMVLAARAPSAYRTFIQFAAWSSVAHGTIMALMAIQVAGQRTELVLSAVAAGIGAVLMLAFLPAKQSG